MEISSSVRSKCATARGVAGVQQQHPQLRLIFKSKKKFDRVDAAKIAKLLYLDAVPQAHVPSADVRPGAG